MAIIMFLSAFFADLDYRRGNHRYDGRLQTAKYGGYPTDLSVGNVNIAQGKQDKHGRNHEK